MFEKGDWVIVSCPAPHHEDWRGDKAKVWSISFGHDGITYGLIDFDKPKDRQVSYFRLGEFKHA